MRTRGNYLEGEENKLGPTSSRSDVKAVLFVPRTRGGELAARLRKEEEKLAQLTGYKVKIVERTGVQVKRILCKTNPWAGESCQRQGCLICTEEGGGKGDCRRRSILYKTTCTTCKEDGAEKDAFYIGESGRSAFERGTEHIRDYEALELDSHMLKHKILAHGDQEKEIAFKMKILKKHNTAFRRQVHEAVVVELNESNNILNSKGGFNRCKLPRLTIKM